MGKPLIRRLCKTCKGNGIKSSREYYRYTTKDWRCCACDDEGKLLLKNMKK